MHFFTEPLKIQIQNTIQAFGAIDINQYRLDNMFSAVSGQSPKAFAVTDGLVLVQEIGTTGKYSIVLKPTTQPDLGLPKIDYIIYKGIKKESIVSGSGPTALVASSNNNDLTKIIHENANAWFNAKNPAQLKPATEPNADKSLGLIYSNKLETASLNEAFYATDGITLTSVTSGNHIGDFDATGDFGIVIIFENIGFKPTFKLARELNSKLIFAPLAASASVSDVFERKHKKEEILSYIDSTAFFGAFSVSGLMVYNGTSFELKKETLLFTDVISKHINKNKIYLDIRNEFNDSFNYYENYGNIIRWSLDNSNIQVDVDYYRNFGWPILIINDGQTTPEFSVANTDKIIKLSFLSPYDTMLIYYKKVFKSSLDFNVPNDKFFYKPALVDGKFSTEDIKAPKNVDKAISNYFQIKILTNAISLNSPPATSPGFPLERKTYLDNLFPIFDMDIPFDQTTGKSVLKIYYDSNFVDKNFINSSNYIANTGIAKDNSFVTLISYPHKYNLNIKQNKDDKIPLSGMEGTSGSLFLKDLDSRISSIKLVKSKLTINATDILFLKFIKDNGGVPIDPNNETLAIDDYKFDDVSILALTNAEYNIMLQLKNTQFTGSYKVYLGIHNVVTDVDDNGLTYTKFEYCLRSIKNNGSGAIELTPAVAPIPAIVSYTDTKLNGIEYTLNYEELIGDNIGGIISAPLEKNGDYFIAKQAPIQTIVNNFETKLNAINPKSINIFKEIKTLVKSESKALWKAAYTYVQSHPTQPDDRPLYWARLKIEVIIKKHPYFLGDLDELSNVVLESELDSIITLFEENSRNYKGVNFSSAPVGAKKILITGFDPFQLSNDISTQNPSGISALQLNYNTINDGLGNIGYIQTAIFPVRYFDFEKGLVENLVSPFLENNSVNMIMSLSLNGGKSFFDLERFAGKHRGGLEDNLDIGIATSSQFIQLSSGNEFYETTLPLIKIITPTAANNFSLNGQKLFYDQSYEAENNNKREHVTVDSLQPNANVNSFPFSEITEKSIKGSGSNYLSNEIFYRIARKRDDCSSIVKTGHFHLANAKSNPTIWTLTTVLKEVEDSIKRALDGI